ncbi:MerR family transcriptional regulator [Paenibacillus tepidiphilus]|uniref:MerR family transcriptional regulator n=1 Tax=Paenibacillus tepidiphilus TaxID=2608683 RepID=UPI00123A13BF|nr:MerR family transcriptional regulator [Paenibacillus tepidiphilus]
MGNYTAQQLADILQREDPEMNLRKVRYYTQIGMLPPLELAGNRRVYTERHLNHLRAVLTLSKSGESLAQIQSKLAGMPDEEIAGLGERLPFYQPEHIMANETLVLSEDVMLTLSPRIPAELKAEMIAAVSSLLKGEKR